jgi:hypothetical protein
VVPPLTADGWAGYCLLWCAGLRGGRPKSPHDRAAGYSASSGKTIKDVVYENLMDVRANVAGPDDFIFAQRQLLYGLRPSTKPVKS